ncbi:hypothetical protein [Nonomuraea jiangxiensis]|uniref:Polyketide cyclase / dehydrase and lipid transport n=1 Tax=Nonomuraea jiangxiensis TaxID=633440 RepID=A0A1G8QL45_9ACTN|nr:hypothetical protein [Nonomuraea jiangxiensis]SDJ05341.1 hypothetical protein SAMN05421869_108281 [Nonomuraea jiangxiensis]
MSSRTDPPLFPGWMRSLGAVWGATAEEMAAAYPCDEEVPNPAEVWFRAVSVRAPRPTAFRWLCQLRVASYSDDPLDGGGLRSPRTLTPGVERLAMGQRFMTVFRLVSFSPDDHITLRLTEPRAVARYGPLTLTYAVRDAGSGATRLVVKLNLGERGDGLLPRARRQALAWADLCMMRRQLLTLRDLAEAASASPSPGRRTP